MEKPFKKNRQSFGPHNIPWELSIDGQQAKFVKQLKLPDDSQAWITQDDLNLTNNHGSAETLRRWFDCQRKVANKTIFTVAEIRHQINLMHQGYRAYRRTPIKKIRAMTILQAKNREFEFVIVLWPFQIQGNAEQQRRLLYKCYYQGETTGTCCCPG